ncbi:MAG: polymer-forming cytoskeletal protein [Deltaproteobacteria bacterium]|nr:polymer-forming cytoskeletal protein [Deltaproteobacteria bacterium]
MERAKIKNNPILALIGKGCLFAGDITITSPSSKRIDGHVRGNFKGRGSLIIGEKGVVSGEVKASEGIVYGKIEGNVESQRLEIKKDASVAGDLFTKSLIIEEGGVYNGSCSMEQLPQTVIGRLIPADIESTEVKMQSKA